MRNVRFAAAFAAAMFVASITQAGTVLDLGGWVPPGGGDPITGIDPIFTFTFSAAGLSGHGTVNTTETFTGSGVYFADSGSITVDSDSTGGAFLGTASLVANGPAVTYSPSGAFITDSLVYDPQPGPNGHLDYYGLLFSGSGWELNLWGNSPYLYSFYTYNGAGFVTQRNDVTFSVASAVPTPASASAGLVLMSVMGGFNYLRKRKAV